jgi:hypothetical protein
MGPSRRYSLLAEHAAEPPWRSTVCAEAVCDGSGQRSALRAARSCALRLTKRSYRSSPAETASTQQTRRAGGPGRRADRGRLRAASVSARRWRARWLLVDTMWLVSDSGTMAAEPTASSGPRRPGTRGRATAATARRTPDEARALSSSPAPRAAAGRRCGAAHRDVDGDRHPVPAQRGEFGERRGKLQLDTLAHAP